MNVSHSPSASYKWGVVVWRVVAGENSRWQVVGWHKTQREARHHAINDYPGQRHAIARFYV